MIIRTMLPADIPEGLALCRANGWNQLAADWGRLLALGREGCVVAETDGRVVGTTTTVDYEGRFAWIGMVLVDQAARGQGIGTALVEHALRPLGDVPARLDATPKGLPLYQRLGFVEESRICRMTRNPADQPVDALGSGPGRPAARRMRESDLATIAIWDRAVFGADRANLLAWAFAVAPERAWIVEGSTGLRGYCLGRPGYTWSQVGPVVATDLEAAFSLVAACVSASAAVPMVLDASACAPDWAGRLAGLGFVEQRPFIRMCRGVNAHPGEGEQQYAIFGPEWG